MARSDIPFAIGDAHTFLPWVIGIMASIAALLLCIGITVSGWVVEREGSYAGHFTVNLPAGDDLAGRTAGVRAELQKLSAIGEVKPLSEADLRDMLRPWLGTGESLSALPLPAVLDVELKPGATVDFGGLEKRLAAIAPGVEVDSQERWVASFSSFSAAMRGLIGLLAAVLLGGLALTIAFASRASLKLHNRTVQLLHSIGAEDSYIAHQFQREAFVLMLRGALPGCIGAGLVFWGAGSYLASLGAAALPSLDITWPHAMLLALMPPACGLLAWATARTCVLRQLRHAL